ncbi:trans-aconitate 2-methyltransferase [Piscinibacter sp. HJYY11]|uniref:class I SAM-dependent methyltransferase n=1 Tax=Piscinibacter sp. HJYY11 TaxID=2801333 RepID=UPI00191F0ADD|nr:biotin synthase [Piscinibacter sp. HJYY11]MBL0730195.1 biotin synthase [Piscinibacter sp. HJYY11]
MSTPSASTARQLDPASVSAWLRRLARSPEAPWLHAEVARRMAERLEFIRVKPEVVLDWWAFGGASTELLLKAYPEARHLAVEPTAALQERSRHATAAPWWSARRWRGPSVALVAPQDVAPSSVQLLWANMMLHAVVDPSALMAQWQRLLAAEGFVMFSCLGPGSLRALHELHVLQGWGPPLADFVDMHDLGDMLVQAGFADPVMDQEVLTLSWDSPEALLNELRALGANASPQRFAGWRTPRWRARLHDALRALARPDGRIYLDFEIAYGHAFKAAPRAPLAAETRVSVEDMRAMVRGKSSRG